jgi:hypothetical protein
LVYHAPLGEIGESLLAYGYVVPREVAILGAGRSFGDFLSRIFTW